MDTQIQTLPILAFLYKLLIGEKYYVGSSIEAIPKRMRTHYKRALEHPERKLYKAVKEAGGWKEVRCELIETMPFTTMLALRTRENQLIDLSDPNCLNSIRAYQTPEQKVAQIQEIKRKAWKRWRQNPEFVEKERERQRKAYQARKDDPEFLEKRRKASLEAYHRRKNASSGTESS